MHMQEPISALLKTTVVHSLLLLLLHVPRQNVPIVDIEMSHCRSRYSYRARPWNFRYIRDRSNINAGLCLSHLGGTSHIWTNVTGACFNPCSYEACNAAIVPIAMEYWVGFILSLDLNARKNPNTPRG